MFQSQLNINNSSWDRRWVSFSLPSNFCLTVFLFVYKSNSRPSVPPPSPPTLIKLWISQSVWSFFSVDVDGWMGRVPFSFLYATADAAISPSASSGAGRAVTYVSIALCRSKLSCSDHSDLSRALLIICASVLQPIRGLPPKHNSCTVSRRAALSRFHIWTIINSDIFTHNRA